MVTTNIPDSACCAALGLFKGPIFYTSSVIYSVDPYEDICVVSDTDCVYLYCTVLLKKIMSDDRAKHQDR